MRVLPDKAIVEANELGDTTIVAVVDTNVLLDLYSMHDAAIAAKKEPELLDYRFRRAGHTLRLAIYLDRTRSTTWGLGYELLEQLASVSPPSAGIVGPAAVNLAVTRTVIHLVREMLIPGWTELVSKPEECIRGNAADTRLVADAERLSVPIITNEGNSHRGIARAWSK
jgi:hypothetical protein